MSEKKQIVEEMARHIPAKIFVYDVSENTENLDEQHREIVALHLYRAGYRKQSVGEWHYPPYAPFGGSYEMKRCSVCGYKPDIDSENPYTKFCHNCGAKMKGV